MKNKTKQLLEESNPEAEILGIFLFGSQTYGTANEESDNDYLVISDGEINEEAVKEELEKNNVNIVVVTPEEYQNELEEMDIRALEVYFSSPHELKYLGFQFALNLEKLRASISKKANHSWVKAKKKITVEKDYKAGIKSLFHALRISNFGFQIAETEKIHDYKSCLNIWKELSYLTKFHWDDLDHQYRHQLNNNLSRFRKSAPKKIGKI